MHKSAAVFITLSVFILAGLNGCAKKRFEDTDTYRELMERQKEVDKKLDSIKNDNYQQLMDSTNTHLKSLDSLKRITDSLRQQLDKDIQNLKNRKQ